MRSLLIWSAGILMSLISYGQSLEQAVTLLNQNKPAETTAVLQSLAAKNESADKAALLATLLELNNEHYDDAFEHFEKFIRLNGDPYPFIYALWTSGLFTENTKKTAGKVDELMKRIASDDKAPLALQAMAIGLTGRKLENANRFAEARTMFKQIADIRNWASVGTFDNTSASGFNKDFGVLAHPEAGYVFTNHTGAPVTWFNMPDARNDRWLDYIYHYETDNAIIYSQTFIQSDVARDVRMLLGVSGSVKVWLNDYLVINEEEERNTDLDVYTVAVKLQKGVNRILIQSGSSEITSSNFMLRFADMNGKLITDLTGSPQAVPYEKAKPYTLTRYAFWPETFFEKKVQDDPGDFINNLLLAYVYKHNDKYFEATRIARQLKKRFPQSVLVSALMVQCYDRDNNNTDKTRETEAIKENAPESLYALQLLYQDAINEEEYDEARKYLDKRIELYGANVNTQYNMLQWMVKKNDVEGILKELENAYTTYPDNATFVNMEYNLFLNVNKDKEGADSILVKYLDDHFHEGLAEILIADKMSLGRKEEALRMAAELVEKRPYSIRQYTKLANRYFELQDYAKAAEWEQKAIDRAPFVGEFLSDLGVIYNTMGKKDLAIGHLQKAIRYSPDNYTARTKLSELQGKKHPFSYFAETDITALYKSSPKAGAYPNDNSIYLLKDLQQVIYPENGASEEKHQYLIKIFNQSGIDDWKEVSIPYNSYTQKLVILKTDILKKDGSRVQAERNDNQIVFSSLEVGDAVYIGYKLENSYSGRLAEHFWQEFSFNSWYPVLQSTYSLVVPSGRKFNYKVYNASLQPVITKLNDDLTMYKWEKTGSQRIEPEANMPMFSDIGERVVVSSIPDWSYVANWYYDLSTIKMKPDYAVREKVKELLAGKENADDLTRARIIYDYIQQNFNYSSVPFLQSALTPQRASRTLNSKLGDCKDLAVLFTSMTREAGLNTHLVLVNTRDEGDNKLDLPTIGFNHCIAMLKVNGKNYLVELTNNHLPFASLPNTDIQAAGLYITRDSLGKATLIKLDRDKRAGNTINRNTVVKVTGNNVQVNRTSRYTGAETSIVRGSYRDQSAEDRNKGLINSLNKEFGKNISLQKFQISNLEVLSDSLTMEYDFNVDNYISQVAGMQVFKFPWSDTYGSPSFVSMEKRIYPINLWSFSTTPYDREVMTFILPPGKKLLEAPKNVSYSCPSMSYQLSFVVKPDRIIATREVKYLADRVPVDGYTAFKTLINNMLEADQLQIAYK